MLGGEIRIIVDRIVDGTVPRRVVLTIYPEPDATGKDYTFEQRARVTLRTEILIIISRIGKKTVRLAVDAPRDTYPVTRIPAKKR